MPGMKRSVHRWMPSSVLTLIRRWRSTWVLHTESWREALRHSRLSGPDDATFAGRLTGHALEAQLTKDYHRVEKGLSLADPKRPFGRDVAERLELMLAEDHTSIPPHVAEHARTASIGLTEWNEHGKRGAELAPSLKSLKRTTSQIHESQVVEFFESRKSVRDFDATQKVDRALLETATRLALTAPSVCNRQASRVSYFFDSEARKVLELQNGNAGFRESVPVVAVVSVERGLFLGPHERNQPWIDGAIFGMSLAWALHGLGLATCLLNWSMSLEASEKLRATAELPASEDIVFLIAIGYPRDLEETRVARSPRRTIDEVARFK